MRKEISYTQAILCQVGTAPTPYEHQDLDGIKVAPSEKQGNPHHQADQDEEGPAGPRRIPGGGDIFV